MRSLLFVPGDSERKIEKALGSGADVVIFDLEDSVSAGAKQAARETVRESLDRLLPEQRSSAPKLFVRVNALDTGLTSADLTAVMPGRPDGIMQPKTRSAADVHTLSAMLDDLEAARGVQPGATEIIAIATETARSLFHMGSYVEAGPRLAGMAWGAEDLSADLGASANRDEHGVYTGAYQLARTLCLAGAVAAGVDPVDTVYVNFRDDDGLRREAEACAAEGFTAKMAIHPAQVPIINEVFTPSPETLARAQRIIEAFASAGDAGVIGLDGEMLDRPHLTRAEKLIARAAKYQAG